MVYSVGTKKFDKPYSVVIEDRYGNVISKINNIPPDVPEHEAVAFRLLMVVYDYLRVIVNERRLTPTEIGEYLREYHLKYGTNFSKN